MDIETLESIGLTKGESKVYLTLIKLGNTSTGAIIKESKVSRSKVYDVLERLKQKGLVTEVTKQNVKFFEATDPKRIIDYLEIKKEDLNKKIKKSKKIVTELDQFKSQELVNQEAKVYTGIEGWKTAYNEILQGLKQGEEYLAFGIGKEEIENKKVSLFIKRFHMRRAKQKTKARIIMHPETKKDMKIFSKLKYYNYRFTETKFPTNIAIWKDNVLTLVWGDNPIAFVIKSEQVADKYRKYFEYLWEQAKK
jgi:HTH-type transcriptional regulator, sugar sensing transcriptional regulator